MKKGDKLIYTSPVPDTKKVAGIEQTTYKSGVLEIIDWNGESEFTIVRPIGSKSEGVEVRKSYLSPHINKSNS